MNKYKKIYSYIYIFFTIFASGIINQHYNYFMKYIILLLSIPFLMEYLKHKKIVIYTIPVIVILILINYVNFSENIIDFIMYIVRMICFIGYILWCRNNDIDLLKQIFNTIIAITIYSTITYILLDFLSIAPYKNIVVNDKPYRVFFGWHYHWQFVNWYGVLIPRNNSIFHEPGMYQIFLNYALVYMFFISNEKINFKKFIIVVANLASTFSTTGMILGIFIMMIKFSTRKFNNFLLNSIKITIFPILFILGICISYYILNQKIQYGVTSYNLRTMDFVNGITLFLQKPITGWGYMNLDILLDFSGSTKNSNGLFLMLYQFGLVGICILVVKMYGFLKGYSSKFSITSSIVIIIYFIVSNMNEPIYYSNYMSLLFSYGIVYSILPNKYKMLGER